LDIRAKVRLYKDLTDDRVRWIQRVHATLFHVGAQAITSGLFSPQGQDRLADAELPAAARQAVTVGLEVIDALTAQLAAVRTELMTELRFEECPTCLREGGHHPRSAGSGAMMRCSQAVLVPWYGS